MKCTATMEDNSSIGIDTNEGIATAEILSFFNDLFDSVNGSEHNDNDLRCIVTENSAHHIFWTTAKNKLRKMCFVDKTTRQIIKTVPSLKNWLFTLDGFEKLWKILTCKYGFTSFKTRYCNQDPIENFFGQVRSHAVRNNNPTPRQFEDSFITLQGSNIKSIKIVGGNCETVGDPFMLLSFEKYLGNNLQNFEVYEVNNNDEPQELVETCAEIAVTCDSSNQFLLD